MKGKEVKKKDVEHDFVVNNHFQFVCLKFASGI